MIESSNKHNVGGENAVHTRPLSPKAAELLQDRNGNWPVWIRPPKTGNDFWCSLSRAKLYELAAAGKIVSRSIREVGQIKGTRLFLLSSVFDFIASCDEGKPEKQAAAAQKGAVQPATRME